MRLWSLHPRYLDPQGLVALWREALLAQAVLLGNTRGYRNHPQLLRFQATSNPTRAIGTFLSHVCAEAVTRGYTFNAEKIVWVGRGSRLKVTSAQLAYEWRHLHSKLVARSPAWSQQWSIGHSPLPHPMFTRSPGPVAPWERIPSA